MRLDENGLNAALTASILPSRQDMRTLGFIERSGAVWGLCKRVGAGATLDLSIPKDGSPFYLDINDEIHGQPYDYEKTLEIDPTNIYALGVKQDVEKILEFLCRVRIIDGYKNGMSIYSHDNSDINLVLCEAL